MKPSSAWHRQHSGGLLTYVAAWWQSALAATFAYLLASALLTWPLIVRLDSMLFGDYGDTRGVVWWLWAQTNGLLDGPTINLLAAPFGMAAERSFAQPFSEWLLIGLSKLFNEIVALNIFVFLAFPLTAIATYFLLDRLLGDRPAAFVGGLIFGFCPAVVLQAAGGHAAFAFNVFIPLFLLALFYNRARRSLVSVLYIASTFALITLTSLYFGYFALYIAIFFFVFDILSSRVEDRGVILRNYVWAGFAGIALIIPFEFQAIYQQLTMSSEMLSKTGRIRDFNDLIIYSSRPWEFIIPSIDHPVFGGFAYEFTRPRLRSNIFEQTLYVSMVALVLVIIGVISAARGHGRGERRVCFLFFVFGALWMYFLSLPPLILVADVNIPTLSYFAYEVAPMFRVYARFGILVAFFVACAAAASLAQLGDRIGRRQYNAMLAILLPILIFEYWSVPPGFALPVNRTPDVYRWLAEEPGDVIIAEYPMMRSDEAAFYTYLFWQRIHKKRLVNGASPDNSRAWAYFQKVNDLSDPATPALLKSAGVKYVIVHQAMYQDGPIPEPIKRYYPAMRAALNFNGGSAPPIPFPLRLHKAFGADMVFSLDALTSGMDRKAEPALRD